MLQRDGLRWNFAPIGSCLKLCTLGDNILVLSCFFLLVGRSSGRGFCFYLTGGGGVEGLECHTHYVRTKSLWLTTRVLYLWHIPRRYALWLICFHGQKPPKTVTESCSFPGKEFGEFHGTPCNIFLGSRRHKWCWNCSTKILVVIIIVV